jgi:biofilm protein TabA
MIVDDISNAFLYGPVSGQLAKGFEVLLRAGLGDLAEGVYETDDAGIRFNVDKYATKPLNEGRFETHDEHIDIQFILSGEEKIGYASAAKLGKAVEKNDDADVAFYDLIDDYSTVTLTPGMFCVFFPQDGHMPCLVSDEACEVKKIVVKVKMKQCCGGGCNCG